MKRRCLSRRERLALLGIALGSLVSGATQEIATRLLNLLS
jgi:hypothetical protein